MFLSTDSLAPKRINALRGYRQRENASLDRQQQQQHIGVQFPNGYW